MSFLSNHLRAFIGSAVVRKVSASGLHRQPSLVRTLTSSMASGADSSCKRLLGKVAVVTGSTDGIGLSIAKRLGNEGAHVVISSRKQANVDRALKELQDANLSVTGTVCHVGKAEHRTKLINETVAKHGGIDILVSNAAVNPAMGPFLETTEEQWDKVFDVNVKAAFLLIKECFPHMKDRKGASIVIVSSISGFSPFNVLGAYSVTKTTLLGLTKTLAGECGPLGVRVNCIAPGVIKTKFSEALWGEQSFLDISLMSASIKRVGEPDECAGAVAFLCSDDASYINGETILITGGLHSRL